MLQSESIQNFNWGRIEWLSEPNLNNRDSKLLIGRAIFKGTCIQGEHYHPDEQVLYIEKGNGVFQIGKKQIPVKSGDVYHTEPFCKHRVINNSDDELVIMITYLPPDNKETIDSSEFNPIREELKKQFLSFLQESFIKESLDKIAVLTNMNIDIMDEDGNLIIGGFNQASFCKLIRSTQLGREYCYNKMLYSSTGNNNELKRDIHIEHCCQNILRISMPFMYHDNHLAYLVISGFLIDRDENIDYIELQRLERLFGFEPDSLITAYNSLTTVTKNNIYAALNLVNSMLENLLNYWIFSSSSSTLSKFSSVLKGYYSKEIKAVIEYININVNKKFSLEELADYVSLNPSYLSRKFKKEVGQSLSKYINNLKVKKAKEMMLEGKYNFKEISYKLNFSNQSYFNRVFKNFSGINPSEFCSG
jgi:AraC-like DNA-binding protein/quercetin dioxygenase-like cupin family protein/ligand-binding sensor protein